MAWVDGTQRYAVLVYFDDGVLDSLFPRPYWTDCKHAVAVVLECLVVSKTHQLCLWYS